MCWKDLKAGAGRFRVEAPSAGPREGDLDTFAAAGRLNDPRTDNPLGQALRAPHLQRQLSRLRDVTALRKLD